MASTSKCPYCGSVVRSDETVCPNCGAPNELFVADGPRVVFQPKTIEELQEYCAERGMPLLRMRFFIGEDYKEPRAFGIYRDGNDVVVYKNKANGDRSIRYRGPDEERGVKELHQKLLEECHNRGIYPDGKPVPQKPKQKPKRKPKRKKGAAKKPADAGGVLSLVKSFFSFIWYLFLCIFFSRRFLIVLTVVLLAIAASQCSHINDGYYRVENDNRVYYHYGSDWYYSYSDDDSNAWLETDSPPAEHYADYSLGEDWDSDWGVGDFKESAAYRSIGQSASHDDNWNWDSWDSDDDDNWDWDSWDSNDTDWDSDW